MPRTLTPVCLLALVSAACGADASATAEWRGTVETLPSGQVVVRNPAEPIWRPGDAWRVEEELRIGRLDGDGPDVFGRIGSFEVDEFGRIWILEHQAQEIRVFAPDGEHVRTVGRRGGGPGEFAQAAHIGLGPDGRMWVMDPQNNRLSVIDTTGAFVTGHRALGGFVVIPWPGRFDAQGRYYAPVPQPGEAFRWALLRTVPVGSGGETVIDLDAGEAVEGRASPAAAAADTLEIPRDPVERAFFEHSPGEGSFIRAGVPYQGTLRWMITDAGTFMALVTDQYRLFELTPEGDTLRTIIREFTPPPVTAADRERARENMAWFTRQGGRYDPSRLPATKPPVTGNFLLDDGGYIWVPLTPEDEDEVPRGTASRFDIFDPDGRYLGVVDLPFPLAASPYPIVRDGVFHGVTQDEFEVQYLVRARVVRPS